MSALELSSTTLQGYVDQTAPKYGLDPAAVLAVSSVEGLGGGIGDQGTSFGPWQLHAGGALPSAEYEGPYAASTQHWAWSAAGVDYALAQMQHVAQGLSGQAAIEAIVTGFERPKNPAAEVQSASKAYGTYSGGGSSGSGGTNPTGSYTGTASDASLVSGILKPGEDVLFRLVFVLGGIALAGLGLILLVRAFTGTAVVAGTVGAAADAITPAKSAVQKVTGSSSSGPRRQGDAAIRRGEPVTRAGRPQARTRRDRRQAARNVRRREREVAAQGGATSSDDIPF